ncbi:MAG: hypothetical protein WAZ98_07680 [Cyclobacteriaceae bacterium]
MKKVLGIAFLVLLISPAWAQSTVDASSKTTHDQAVVREMDRKSKSGKKDLSLKKKVKIDKKESRKRERKKQPKQPKRKD